MLQTLLNDKLWLKLKPILLDLNIYDKPNLRNIFTGILYRLKTGCPWRYLPECFGKYNTVFKTFRRWTKLDKFTKIFKQLIKDPDMEWHIYKARHVVENMFATLKHFRGLATRYDKLKSSYSSNVALACAYVWLKL